MYLSSQDDPGTSYDERVPSANSPSTEEDEDSNVDRLEGDSNDEEDIGSVEPPIQSIIGPDGFRQFILLLLWTVNEFYSTIKIPVGILREKYQIPVGIPIRLPFKFEKCYY